MGTVEVKQKTHTYEQEHENQNVYFLPNFDINIDYTLISTAKSTENFFSYQFIFYSHSGDTYCSNENKGSKNDELSSIGLILN